MKMAWRWILSRTLNPFFSTKAVRQFNLKTFELTKQLPVHLAV